MKQSFTYYLTLLVIKIKGLKKIFSQDPVDFKKLRKEDVLHPKGTFMEKYIKKQHKILGSEITEITKSATSKELLVFIHGGAFISGPAQHHWDAIKEIASKTNLTIWMCNYPKAPEHTIKEISRNIDAIYNSALKEFKAHDIILLGDSVGGTLITALTQRLIVENKELPDKLMLVSPVMDASMSNPEIDIVDKKDPMLSKVGLLSAKKMCVGDVDLKDMMISPLYGSFNNFPKTVLFLAENDITYPDQKILVNKLRESNTEVTIVEGANMPHIWPFLPVMKEAKQSLEELINILNE